MSDINQGIDGLCPHCDKILGKNTEVVFNQMGHTWHIKCWEAFKAEYNDVLDSQDLNPKKES